MKLVKKFDKSILSIMSDEPYKSIDNDINDWIKEEKVNIIDIKYVITDQGYESVLVIYENGRV